MNDVIGNWFTAVLQNLIASFLAVVFGIAFTQLVRRHLDQHKYGRWHVVVKEKGETIVERAISVRKAKEILDEPADLSVFLKGVVSPYAKLNCDLVKEGADRGLLVRDNANRQFIVDLDQNPPQKGPSTPAVL